MRLLLGLALLLGSIWATGGNADADSDCVQKFKYATKFLKAMTTYDLAPPGLEKRRFWSAVAPMYDDGNVQITLDCDTPTTDLILFDVEYFAVLSVGNGSLGASQAILDNAMTGFLDLSDDVTKGVVANPSLFGDLLQRTIRLYRANHITETSLYKYVDKIQEWLPDYEVQP